MDKTVNMDINDNNIMETNINKNNMDIKHRH